MTSEIQAACSTNDSQTRRNCVDLSGRPYIWLTHGFTCFLRTMNLGFVVLWIISASQDNLRLMIFSSTAILGRLVATILHAFTPGSIDLYSASFKADAYQLIALHPEELILGNVGMFIFITAVIEVAFVSPLIVYQQGFYMRKEREAVVASDEVHAQAQTSTGHREHSGDDYSDELSIEADGDRPAMSSDLPTASSGYTGSDKK